MLNRQKLRSKVMLQTIQVSSQTQISLFARCSTIVLIPVLLLHLITFQLCTLTSQMSLCHTRLSTDTTNTITIKHKKDLLDLPPEIRLRIYKYLCCSQKRGRRSFALLYFGNGIILGYGTSNHSLSILRTNHLIYEEAARLLLHRTKVMVQIHYDERNLSYEKHTWVKPGPSRGRALLAFRDTSGAGC